MTCNRRENKFLHSNSRLIRTAGSSARAGIIPVTMEAIQVARIIPTIMELIGVMSTRKVSS